MTDLQNALITVYAKGRIEEVHASQEYQELCDQQKDRPDFAAERKRVEELRFRIDQLIRPGETEQTHVSVALRLVWKLHKNEERAIYSALVLRSIGQNWEPSRRNYFEEKTDRLMRARHYFLSFTSRNPGLPNQNDINTIHREFIKEALGTTRYDAADKSKENLLAAAIDHLLRSRALDGFYFPAHLEDNTVVEQKLRDNCRNCLSFVQLIQGAIFSYHPELQNWCFFEYNEVLNSNASVLFVQGEEQIDGANIYAQFDAWYGAFAARDRIRFEETRYLNQQTVSKNMGRIDELADQIRNSLNQIFVGVPN